MAIKERLVQDQQGWLTKNRKGFRPKKLIVHDLPSLQGQKERRQVVTMHHGQSRLHVGILIRRGVKSVLQQGAMNQHLPEVTSLRHRVATTVRRHDQIIPTQLLEVREAAAVAEADRSECYLLLNTRTLGSLALASG